MTESTELHNFKPLFYYFLAYIHNSNTVNLWAFKQCSFRKDEWQSLALRAIILVEKNITFGKPTPQTAMSLTPRHLPAMTFNFLTRI
jgi:hypothetical protein